MAGQRAVAPCVEETSARSSKVVQGNPYLASVCNPGITSCAARVILPAISYMSGERAEGCALPAHSGLGVGGRVLSEELPYLELPVPLGRVVSGDAHQTTSTLPAFPSLWHASPYLWLVDSSHRR